MVHCGKVSGQSVTKQTLYQSSQRKKLSALKSVNGRQIFRGCMMKQRNGKKLLQLMLLSLVTLLQACASKSNICPQITRAQVPPLPSYAEQTQPPTWCGEKCSATVSEELKAWQQLLIEAERKD